MHAVEWIVSKFAFQPPPDENDTIRGLCPLSQDKEKISICPFQNTVDTDPFAIGNGVSTPVVVWHTLIWLACCSVLSVEMNKKRKGSAERKTYEFVFKTMNQSIPK